MQLATRFLKFGSVHMSHVPCQGSQLPLLVYGKSQREYRQGYQSSAQ